MAPYGVERWGPIVVTYAVLVAAWQLQQPVATPAPTSVDEGTARDGAVALAAAGLTRAATSEPLELKTFAVGFNAAVDLIVPARDVFAAIGLEPPGAGRECESLGSLAELATCFAHSFAHGTAAERWFEDASIFDQIAATARALDSAAVHVGGNAALMGQHLVEHELAKAVLLVSAIGPMLDDLLDARLLRPQAPPALQKDEMHLILEYETGEKWGSFVSQRANRFIFSHDVTNAAVKPLDIMGQVLTDFHADVVVVSGVHMLEGLPPAQRAERIQELVRLVEAIPATQAIHLELASIGDLAFLDDLVRALVPRVDSVGLNEQELCALARASGGPHQGLLEEHMTVPEVALISDLVHWLLETYGGGSSQRLSRVHFHSLTYHMLGYLPEAWSNMAGAVASGTLACSRQACETTKLNGFKFRLQFPASFALHIPSPGEAEAPQRAELARLGAQRAFEPDQPISEWQRGGHAYALAPVLVCRQPSKTVGLGDAISASGLAHSRFLR